MRGVIAAAMFGLAAVSIAQPAQAHAIDGNWCSETDLRVSISGSSIVTPGGTRTVGDYTRYFVTYVAPAGDPQPGATVTMQLLTDEAMQVRVGPQGAETWRRCGPPIS